MALFGIDFSKAETRDAARLAIQSAFAAALTFIVMKSLGLPERFVGILSAVMVIQPTAGAVIGEATDRFLATLVGAIVGVICLILLPDGYGTAAALAVSMLVMNAIAGFKSEWRYGVVAAVALSLGAESDATQVALDRSISIGLGVVIGALVALVIWRDKAEDRARRNLKRAIEACAELLDAGIETAKGDKAASDDCRALYRRSITGARDAIDAIHFGKGEPLSKRRRAVEELWNASTFLVRIGEDSDPAKGDLSDRVDAVREDATALARQLAKGEAADEDRLSRLKHSLEDARAAVSGNADGNRAFAVTAEGALVFTLGEVIDSLETLNEAIRDAA
jgi:uncharacterized membrane protein YccC